MLHRVLQMIYRQVLWSNRHVYGVSPAMESMVGLILKEEIYEDTL